MVELKPPKTAVAMVDVPLLLRATETAGGEAAMVNVCPATMKVTVALWVIPPPVPVTVTVYVPAGVDDPAVRVKVEAPAPGAAMDGGLNAAVAPVGRPDALQAIAELKLPDTEAVIVVVPPAPGAADTDVGEAEIVKEGAVGAVTVRKTVAVGCIVVVPTPFTVTA